MNRRWQLGVVVVAALALVALFGWLIVQVR